MKIDSKNPPTINSFSPLPTWVVCFTSRKVIAFSVAYLREVLYDFFVLQFLRKLKLIRIPVLNVENPLDQKVPFVPHCIDEYLHFVNFWLCPLGMLVKVLGAKKAAPLLANYLSILRKTYKYAAQIYKFCMTTTNRPLYKKRTSFVVMRLLDPHYLCVPSLHVAIVVLCYAFFREALCHKDFSAEQRELWTREIYEGAVKITETVLYVKQHSVNCIPAALYMMTKVVPQKFSADDARNFLDDMFKTRNDIPQTDRAEVIEYMKNLFNQFYSEGENSLNWSEPIKNWIKEYAQKTGQNLHFQK